MFRYVQLPRWPQVLPTVPPEQTSATSGSCRLNTFGRENYKITPFRSFPFQKWAKVRGVGLYNAFGQWAEVSLYPVPPELLHLHMGPLMIPFSTPNEPLVGDSARVVQGGGGTTTVECAEVQSCRKRTPNQLMLDAYRVRWYTSRCMMVYVLQCHQNYVCGRLDGKTFQ